MFAAWLAYLIGFYLMFFVKEDGGTMFGFLFLGIAVLESFGTIHGDLKKILTELKKAEEKPLTKPIKK